MSAVEGRISGAADHIDLTPDPGLPLFGFVDRTGPSEGVADSLEANAIALRDAAGRIAVIVVFDTLFVGPTVDAELRAFLRDNHGVRDEDILLLASHSHNAPALDPTKPMAGAVDSAYLASVIERSKVMLRRLLDRPMVPLSWLTRAHLGKDPFTAGNAGRCPISAGIRSASASTARRWRPSPAAPAMTACGAGCCRARTAPRWRCCGTAPATPPAFQDDGR